jgi:hypothetical protein
MATKPETKPAEITLDNEGAIDISQITDPTLRAMVEQLVQESQQREAQLVQESQQREALLKQSLARVRANLMQERSIRRRNLPPTQDWNKNEAPLTVRQRNVIGKSIRLIARELSGKYTVNKRTPAELTLMKAVASRLGECIAEFGVPEETDPAYQRISASANTKLRRKGSK